MKYLVLAYGHERDWKASQSERDTLLAQDDLLRRRGSLVAAVENAVTTVRSWDGMPTTTSEPFPTLLAPLAGFGIIEAIDLSEAIALVAQTPCARAKGAVEIRPVLLMNSDATVVG